MAPNHGLVIEGGTLIDGTARSPQRNAAVVMEGNRITAVGEKGKVPYPPGAQVIPAAGKFILPGLIDMHVHWADWMPELFLAHGITSAVDLVSTDWTLEQSKALSDGRIAGPRLFAALGPFAGRLLWDRLPSEIDSAEVARRIVREAGSGRSKYALTKVYTELTPDQLHAVVEESHKAGRNVIAHLGSLDARQAAEAGVDALAHASGVALATIPDRAKADDLRTCVKLGISIEYPLFLVYHAFVDRAKVKELTALLIRKNVRLEPDLINTARWGAKDREAWIAEDAKILSDPNLKYIPSNNRDRILFSKPLERLSKEEQVLLGQGYENLRSFLRGFIQAGGTILAGSDTAAFVLPGASLHRELELLVDVGLTPMQAIQAATKNNAEFLQESDLGTIEPGKLADVIVIGKDPLSDIKNTNSVEVVIKDGTVMDTSYHADFVNPIPRARVVGYPNPRPSIRTLYPMTCQEVNRDLELIIEGANFIDDSIVDFDGVTVPATPVKSTLLRETKFYPVYTQLAATVPARLLNRAASYKVFVKNPTPEGGVSNVLTFFVAS